MKRNIILYLLFETGLNAKIFNSSMIEYYLNADFVIDLSGDSYIDKKGFFLYVSLNF